MALNDQSAKVSVQDMISKQRGKKGKKWVEKSIPVILFIIASISVLTTFGIVFTLIFETYEFFQRVPFFD
ncbi:MAG: phosphate ABC transporter permease subunit PstC, partial [Paenisporosarcina sp.]|nr:phosphate ABC transporter permease subunit PstC [Paenisporosarcina sp.]